MITPDQPIDFAATARQCRDFALILAIKTAIAKPAMDEIDFEIYSAARRELMARGLWQQTSATLH